MSQSTIEAKRPAVGESRAAGDTKRTVGVSATDSTTTFTPRQAARAQAILRSLLNGHPPDGISSEDYGPWGEVLAELYNAHAVGGTEAVRRSFNAMAKAHPSLMARIANAPKPPKTRWTVAELLSTEFPEPHWAVPGIIPVGLTFLAGRPKLGKSWLGLQIAHAMGTGGVVLDQQISRGNVLYLAFEDSPRRLKDRLTKQGIPSDATITFETRWPALIEGGLANLQAEIEQNGYTLVIVDTFARVAGQADQSDVAEMTAILSNLQQIAQIYDLAILLIDHHRKKIGFVGGSPIDDIIGSTAKAAVADTVLGLFREQGKHGARLKIIGRDVEEQDLALEWDGQLFCWHLLGEAGQVLKDTLKGEILDAICDLMSLGETPSTTRIATHLGKDKGNVSRELANLVATGKVIKGEKQGREQPYWLPAADGPEEV